MLPSLRINCHSNVGPIIRSKGSTFLARATGGDQMRTPAEFTQLRNAIVGACARYLPMNNNSKVNSTDLLQHHLHPEIHAP